MKILNIGSLNIDDVYSVEHFVQPGETLGSNEYNQFCGGKGLNQSIALANAGAEVYHAGAIGRDGLFLKERLDKAGVDTSLVKIGETPTGRAIIQVVPEGENSIILYNGANHSLSTGDISNMLAPFGAGDYLLLQNEINNPGRIINAAAEKGMIIALNPAPMEKSVLELPLDKISIFIVNEIEGEGFTGESEPAATGEAFERLYPGARLVLTLGAAGVYYRHKGKVLEVPAEKIKPIDTTAAGDTFIGYLLAGLAAGNDTESVLKRATKASAVTCMRLGAADSIPKADEI
ncbi:MAG: ribokinase [Spirochaetales bacterium]|uniref:Ribokinase n=1 Tax=Candidatus Thalassospirochaeta sargassi TaxID=3119039 RepID=A0AAJ1MNU6_9SPIO|nr:ribokinase [Spirochaetales bacterium]